MPQIKAIVFDLYGTLFDVHSVAAACESEYPGRGREISALWRQKQLEYTWLRSLMQQYADFEQCTADALVYACKFLQLDLSAVGKTTLCDAYLRLAPFPDVPAALKQLNSLGYALAILSNGSTHSIDTVVRNAGLSAEFKHLISVDSVRTFKPHATVYELAERQLHVERASILFVSSNAWDATGASYFGYPTCWVNRSGTFDEMGRKPDHIVTSISAVGPLLSALQRS